MDYSNIYKMGGCDSTLRAVVYVSGVIDMSSDGYYMYSLEPYPTVARLYYNNPKFGVIREKLTTGNIFNLELEEKYHDDGCFSHYAIKSIYALQPEVITLRIKDVIPAHGLKDHWEILTKKETTNHTNQNSKSGRITIFIETNSLPNPDVWKGKTIKATLQMFARPNRFKILSFTKE